MMLRGFDCTSARAGYSLIEMVAVAALSTLLFAVAVTVLIKLDRQEHQIGLRYRQSADLNRLADQFRVDVHAAEFVDIETNDKSSGLFVSCKYRNGSRIDYRQIKQHVIRITTDSAGQERQERFLFTPETNFSLKKTCPKIVAGSPPEPIASDRGQLVTLTVRWPMNGQKYDAFRQLPITAQIGRDLPVRLLRAESSDAAP